MSVEISRSNSPAVQAGSNSKTRNVQASSVNGESDDSDNSAVAEIAREIQKNIRNYNKKLNLMSKLDSIIAQHPGVSLDDLVQQRKINADQKAQALKKPSLQASLEQCQQQLDFINRIQADLEQRFNREKEQIQARHQDEISRIQEEVKQQVTSEVEAQAQEQLNIKVESAAKEAVEAEVPIAVRTQLWTVSRFLRSAADRRHGSGVTDEESSKRADEVTQAFESILFALYGGDRAAVKAAEDLVNGSEKKVLSSENIPLNVTFAEVKEVCLSSGIDAKEALSGWDKEEAAGADSSETRQAGESAEGTNGAFEATSNGIHAYNGDAAGEGENSFNPDQGDGEFAPPAYPSAYGSEPPQEPRRDRPAFRGGSRGGRGGGRGNGDTRGRGGWGRGRGRGGFRNERGRGTV